MGNPTQIRLNSYLLPSLGGLFPGPKNVLSPLGLHFDQQPAPGELAATGLLDPQGKLKAAYQPWLAILANPASLVDLRFTTGEHLQQFSLYFGQPDAPPILMMNTSAGLLLEYPADTKAIVNGLLQFSSDSLVVSFDFEATLPTGPAIALAALVDLHRREVARAFADLALAENIFVSALNIENWIAHCPEDPQWITALMPQPGLDSAHATNVKGDINYLIENGICETSGKGYALVGAALALGNRMVMIDNLYSVDIVRGETAGQVRFASMAALQAGINDLLQINFLGDEVAFKSLSPIGFILQIEDFLEQGGQLLPDLPAPAAPVDQPAKMVVANAVWGLVVPGKEAPFQLAETTSIGRADNCNLQLNDSEASRQHARIERRQDGFWIMDLNSSNGVFVNGNHIAEAVRLSPGDKICIGDTTLQVVTETSSVTEDANVLNLHATAIQSPVRPQVQSQFIEGQAPSTNACHRCGGPLSPTARFCAKCGTPVEERKS